MQQLKGKTIFLGKDPIQRCLCVAIDDNGRKKLGAIGSPGSVPASVSRIVPEQETAHASILVDSQGVMTIYNLKPQNVTYVNGIEVVSKRISETSVVEFGFEKYRVDIAQVLNVAKKLVGTENIDSESHPFDINHLSRVWDEYHDRLLDIKLRQKRLGLMASASLIFSLGSGALSVMSHNENSALNEIAPILTVVGFVVCAMSFYLRSKDNSIEEQEAALDEFQERYVCPNCGKFLGNFKYNIMKRQYDMRCPHCKCKFVEK